MVAMRTPEAGPAIPQACADAANRSLSSTAASLPKVQSTNSSGGVSPRSSRLTALLSMQRVLPEPGPATTSSGPSVWPTTSLCPVSSSGRRRRIIGAMVMGLLGFRDGLVKMWYGGLECVFRR